MATTQKLCIELVPDPDLGGFTARLPGVPACGEGETEKKAIEDLKEALTGYIEAFGLEHTLSLLEVPTIRYIKLDLSSLVDE